MAVSRHNQIPGLVSSPVRGAQLQGDVRGLVQVAQQGGHHWAVLPNPANGGGGVAGQIGPVEPNLGAPPVGLEGELVKAPKAGRQGGSQPQLLQQGQAGLAEGIGPLAVEEGFPLEGIHHHHHPAGPGQGQSGQAAGQSCSGHQGAGRQRADGTWLQQRGKKRRNGDAGQPP